MKKMITIMVMAAMVMAVFTGCKTDGKLMRSEKHETYKVEAGYYGDLMGIAYKVKHNW